MKRPIVLASVRPMESTILRHLIGFLKQILDRQPEARCFFMIADYHALIPDRIHPREIELNIRHLVTDLLASGFDPERSVCFLQSQVPQLAELAMILDHSIPLPAPMAFPEARRKPDAARRSSTAGFTGYPIFQPADVLLFRPSMVTAGPGQQMRSNLCREAARRFNREFGTVFPLPGFEQSVRANGTRGITGIRVRHSNAVGIADADARVGTKTNGEARKDAEQEPFRIAETQLEGRLSLVGDVLHLGGSEARIEGQRTLEAVKKAVGLRYGILMG